MPALPTLDNLDVAGKRVLLRVDLNVPMKNGRVTDTTRIDRIIPTVKELSAKGAKVILLSHFGRPKGKPVADMSLAPLAGPLATALGGAEIVFAGDCIGETAKSAVDGLKNGQIALFENLRFHPGEESNDPEFAQALAANGDLYVNDAFSAAHRAHGSTEALARLLPHAAGRLMEEELTSLAKAFETPTHPAAAFVGGAKISTKLDLLGNLSTKVDMLAIGGGMANTFLHALGTPVGRSLCEHELAGTARNIFQSAKDKGCEIILPIDAVVAAELKPGVETAIVAINAVPEDMMILDIGPKTAKDLSQRLSSCKTLIWNGPLGAFETPPFDAGTVEVARKAARLTTKGQLISVAGGGDTVAALVQADAAQDFTYISTAGGAFLEWLEGKTLPGIAALSGK